MESSSIASVNLKVIELLLKFMETNCSNSGLILSGTYSETFRFLLSITGKPMES